LDEDRFWQIIQTSLSRSGKDFDQQQEELAAELRSMTPDELILFGNRFRYFRGLANTWELWGAIYLIHGGCGDDSFNDFREWLIGQGRERYFRTIYDPGTLIELEAAAFDIGWEGLGYVPGSVFLELTGSEMPYPFREQLETTGNEWDEEGDDLERMFPELAAKYLE
jgi:hypothetical protein